MCASFHIHIIAMKLPQLPPETISSTDHKNGSAGQYFNFNVPTRWTPKQAAEVKQCRNGQAIWSGRIFWWNSKNGGSTGILHGRRDSGASSGQWQFGDTATDGICQALAVSYATTGITRASPTHRQLVTNEPLSRHHDIYEISQIPY